MRQRLSTEAAHALLEVALDMLTRACLDTHLSEQPVCPARAASAPAARCGAKLEEMLWAEGRSRRRDIGVADCSQERNKFLQHHPALYWMQCHNV